MRVNRTNLLKKICAVSLAAAMLAGAGLTEAGTYIGTAVQVGAVTSSSEETPASSFEYEEDYVGGITITKFIGDETNVVIPSKIDGKAVTSIGDSAFDSCESLTNVTIPDSVTSIEYGAFKYCTSLTEVTIPNSVTSIENSAFENCTSLTEVTIPNSVTSIENSAFENCTSLTEVTIPNSVISMGDSAFSGCTSLTEVTIPNSVTSIKDYAFRDCTSLKEVTIPNSVTSVGDRVFSDCTSLKKINVDKNNKNYSSANGVLFNKDKTTLIQYPSGKADTEYSIPNSVTSIESGTFYGCTSLEKVTIGNGVTSIGNSAFSDCTSLTEVTIGNGVTSIGERAFRGCTSLEKVTIPDSVTSIESGTFYGCTSLEKVTIGSSVTSIYSAFDDCTSLKEINVDKNNKNYSSANGVLFNKDKTTLIQYPRGRADTEYSIPNSVKSIGSEAFKYCTSLKKAEIPNSVTNIGRYAFYDCTSLTKVAIGNGVTSIGESAFSNTAWYDNQPDGVVYAGKVAYKYKGEMPENTKITLKNGTIGIADSTFYNCTNLTEVAIPDSVTNIGSWAFDGCTSLKKAEIPNSVTSIGSEAFKYCTSLTEVKIPNSITSIGYSAFEDTAWYDNQPDGVVYAGKVACTYKGEMPENTKITLKDGTVSIADSTFYNCTNLTEVAIPDSVTSIGEWAFEGCTSLKEITIGNGVTSIGDGAFWSCTNLTEVTIPNSVTSIGDSAFAYCDSFTKVTIPNSVTRIEDGAFNGCINLTEVTIPNSVTSIGDSAFFCCNLTEVTIPNSVTSIGDSAFWGCTNLTEVTIPNSVTSIGDSAFWGCTNLTEVTIPNSVTSIGDGAFGGIGGSNLKEINVDKNNKNYSSENGVLYNKDKTKLIYVPEGYDKTYAMPDTVIKIENSALYYYNNSYYNIIFSKALKSIDVVIDIDGYVVIPETVTYISNDALKSVSAIYGYKNSEAQKYAEKNNITFIDMDSVKKETGKYTLNSKNNDNTFIFMAQSDNFYNFSFKSESNFEYEAVNGNVEVSDYGTSCRYSKDLKKGDIITFKFSGNTSDINIDISNIYEDVLNNQTNEYVDYKFENKTVYIRGNGYIPDNYSDWQSSFYYGLDINNVVIENGITSIGSRVFYNLKNLKSVYIPESVTQIADDAFIYKYFEPTTSDEPITSEGEDKIMDYITIYGAKNSYAETYAKEKNIPFVAVNEIKDKNSNITVTGNLSDKTKLSVKSLSYKDISVGDDTTVRAYYDISLLENGKKVQPNAPVTVKIPYIGNTNNIEVYRINNDGTNEKMLSNYSNGVINFVTDHFSKYAIVTAAGMLGDTNGDGKVNIADALMIARYDAKLTTLNDAQLSVSDVNGDSKVNIADALKIARFDAKLIDKL